MSEHDDEKPSRVANETAHETAHETGPMPHEEAIGLLDALKDGELDDDEAARVKEHLATCERCQKVEAALGGGLREVMTDGAAKSQNADTLLPAVQRKLRMRSRGKFYAEPEERRRGPSPWPLVIASVLVLGALVVSYLLLGHVGATSSPKPTTSSSIWVVPAGS